MSTESNNGGHTKDGRSSTCFLALFITLIVLLVGYPYLRDDELGVVLIARIIGIYSSGDRSSDRN